MLRDTLGDLYEKGYVSEAELNKVARGGVIQFDIRGFHYNRRET